MEAIISAEELLCQHSKNYGTIKNNPRAIVQGVEATNAMIQFAKIHRKAILEEIAEDYLYYLEGDEGSERLNEQKFFKEVYSENNIK